MLGGKGAANASFSHKSKKPKINVEDEIKGWEKVEKCILVAWQCDGENKSDNEAENESETTWELKS